MTTRHRSHGLLALALLAALAPPAAAQSRDSALVAQIHRSTDSLTAKVVPVFDAWCKLKATTATRKAACILNARLVARIAADATAFWPRTVPTTPPATTPPVVPPDSSSTTTKPDTAPPVVVTPPPTPAPPSAFAVPTGLGGGVAAVAELPRDTAATPYPVTTSLVRVPAGANLQQVLNQAQPGDLIALAPGAVYTGDFQLPKHAGAGAASCSSWIVVRTDVPDSLLGAPGVRMTPTRAAALKLARIQTPDNQQAIGSAWSVASVGCWRLVGLEVLPGPTGNDVNGLVRFGDHNATDSTQQAHHLVLDRSYVHGSSTPSPKGGSTLGQVRRCVLLNSRWNVVVDSWIEYCRGGNGDTQTGLSYAGTGPYRYTNNHLSGGTEVLMFGGANGGIVGATPSDITIHGNYVTRELADTVTLVKNLLEVKNAERLDAAGNVFRLNWADGQVGFGILLKSVNQSSGPCTWCRARDITVRYNRLTQSAQGFNLAGIQEAPAQPAMRYAIYGNVIDSLGFRRGEGRPFQLLGGSLSDVILAYNSVAPAPWGLMATDQATARVALQGNALYCGGYGIKGGGIAAGMTTITAAMVPYAWTGNVLFGCSSGYPSGSTYTSSLSAAIALPSVGAQLGTLLSGVVVAP